MFPSTGHVPTPFHTCIRCGRLNDCSLYLLCQDCRDADLILAAAARFVAEREESLRTTLCQCGKPDPIIKSDLSVFCVICGGDVHDLKTVFDPMQDYVDARREATFGVGL